MTTYERGVVVGKFLPLHDGHQHLIEVAAGACTELHVVVADDPDGRPRAAVRADWIRELYPQVNVHTADDLCVRHRAQECAPECSPAWVAHLRHLGIDVVDATFSSEAYGSRFAAAWGPDCVNVQVDPDRVHRPVSGTAVRDNPHRYWNQLAPVVRVGMVRRIVILGAESTGTTTLAQEMAATLRAPYVPEYGRTHSQLLADLAGTIDAVTWGREDFDIITTTQQRLETAGATAAANTRFEPDIGPLVICDTDPIATAVWQERYEGTAAESTGAWTDGTSKPAWAYVLTGAEIPFEDDGLRDGEHLREAMTARFRQVLNAADVPWIEVRGSRQERLECALGWIRELNQRDPWLGWVPS